MIRGGLVFLAVSQGLVGVLQLFFPRTFYDNVPIPGHSWVAMFPPYNEHLMRDLGAATSAYVLVLVVAVVTMERRMVATALVANLVFTVPHFVFHAVHMDNMPRADWIAQTLALALGVVIPGLLLGVLFSQRKSRSKQTESVEPM
ncbi:hypothetical protein [Kibdelosporangium phytohabitans]|uniref:Uncharacterized protein n=1 Tax=Kibdelosporangium phytohabitans TaxID=860235 RepID=A0A0N9HXC3_9PSEU|nr:hypothetical protein [Kibdelosporangium phytohabitans]ALG06713.1 hypothetical protein AOZ06_07025 [Kibdelosporangium phytohabitans]MBE1467935.1 putative histidine transporter YuiF (NhaC family) [Kibdelosporangium phytohabitans]